MPWLVRTQQSQLKLKTTMREKMKIYLGWAVKNRAILLRLKRKTGEVGIAGTKYQAFGPTIC